MSLPIEVALEWHLTSNHFPPVHSDFIPSAIEAIEAIESGDFDGMIDLPNGRTLSVEEVMEGLHLWDFVNVEDE